MDHKQFGHFNANVGNGLFLIIHLEHIVFCVARSVLNKNNKALVKSRGLTLPVLYG